VLRHESLLDSLLELQILDRVPRSGWALRGVPEPESVSEHAFHVVLLVWALAAEVPGLDAARAAELAIVHDLAEVRLGDLPRTAARYLPAGAKKASEGAAIGEILAPLPASARELWEDYAAGVSPEAKLVKACDKLQLMIKVAVYESWGEGRLTEFWGNADNFPDVAFPPVREVLDELRRRYAS
jgi:putative hydrolase of HD superfamily